MTDCKVSILIPAYNAAPWIEEALASALSQDYADCEIIVVDDGSADDTVLRARRMAESSSGQIRIATQPNHGAAAARNHALSLAAGNWIQYLDADDLLAPDKISVQMRALSSAPPTTVSMGTWGRFHDSPQHTIWNNESVFHARSGVEFLQIHYETGSMMQPGGWLVHRSVIDRAGPWNESLSLNDDGEFFARVVLAASSLRHAAEAKIFYRAPQKTNLSQRRDSRALVSLFDSVKLTVGHLLKHDQSSRTRVAINRAWRRVAYDLYPDNIELALSARSYARLAGPGDTPIGGTPKVHLAAKLVGWRLARLLEIKTRSMR
jgi:glycosyltransferase involved in cell wall biosynthesis